MNRKTIVRRMGVILSLICFNLFFVMMCNNVFYEYSPLTNMALSPCIAGVLWILVFKIIKKYKNIFLALMSGILAGLNFLHATVFSAFIMSIVTMNNYKQQSLLEILGIFTVMVLFFLAFLFGLFGRNRLKNITSIDKLMIDLFNGYCFLICIFFICSLLLVENSTIQGNSLGMFFFSFSCFVAAIYIAADIQKMFGGKSLILTYIFFKIMEKIGVGMFPIGIMLVKEGDLDEADDVVNN